MKYIMRYNESVKTLNNSYVQLLDTLLNVFDDYNVTPLPDDHDYGEYGAFLEDNTSIYWSFFIEGSDEPTSNINTKNEIKSIMVFNVKDVRPFMKSLYEEVDRIKGITKEDVIFKYETIDEKFHDVTIKITTKEDMFHELSNNIDWTRYDVLSDEDKDEVTTLLQKLSKYL